MEKAELLQVKDTLKTYVEESDCVLVGLGEEWALTGEHSEEEKQSHAETYNALAGLLTGKPYYMLSQCEDTVICRSRIPEFFICAPFAPEEESISGEARWQEYLNWLSATMGRKLLLLELGVGFARPEVIRWPFEQCARFNLKAKLVRIHHSLALLPEGLEGRGEAVRANSYELFALGEE